MKTAPTRILRQGPRPRRSSARLRPILATCCALLLAAPELHAGDGEKMLEEIRENEGLYEDSAWQDYVREIGERLLAVSPDEGKEYHFVVVDSPAVNAAATGDGYIFIFRGIIAHVRSEDELAAIIGHEIGHVVGRHTARTKGMNRLGGLLGWIGAIGTASWGIKDVSDTLTATAISREAREYELEADAYGAEFLARAGYDPLAAIATIHVLKEQELFARSVKGQPPVYHGLFGTHPRNDKRLHDAVQKAVPLSGGRLRPPERDFWAMVDGLVHGNEAATGLIKGDAYYHMGLRIVVQFPTGWNLGNTPSEVFGRDAGDAEIRVQRHKLARKKQTPENYLKKTLKRDDLNDGEKLTVNNYPAYMADVEILDGKAAARKIAAVVKGNAVYLFKGELGVNGDVARFEQQFEDTLRSFRAMTAEDLSKADRPRIDVLIAEPGDTYANLALRSSIKSFPEETLRIINGHYPRGEPRAGDPIKLVR